MASVSRAHRPGRLLLLVLSVLTLVYTLAVVVFGVVDLVTQLAAHTIRLTLYWSPDRFAYTDDGDGHSGIHIAGVGGAADTAIVGLPSGVVALHVASTIVALLMQFALAALALRMLARLRAGRPFDRSAWREVAAAGVIVLVIGIVSQLLAWWDRVAVIHAAGGDAFSTAFVFEPLTVTIGLTLAIVAVAFRAGERLQRDTEGLV